jgi:vancomycin resistance protein YoaR
MVSVEEQENAEIKDIDIIKTEHNKFDKNLIIKISGVVCILLILSLIVFNFTIGYNKIYNGISINRVDVGGKSVEEAKKILDNYYQNINKMNVTVLCDNQEEIIQGDEISISFDSSEAAKEAYETGREEGFFTNIFDGIRYQIGKKDINFSNSYDRLKFDSKIAKLTSKVIKEKVDPTYVREGDKLFIKTGITGIDVDENYIKTEILNRFNYYDTETPVICNSTKISPTPVEMAKIRTEIKKDVQDAQYINNSGAFEVTPQVTGVDFDLAEANKIANSISEEGVQFSVELIITMPQSTTEEILKDLFKDELSSFTTYFNVNEKERSENVKLAAQFINNTIIMPGQEFSYNTTVGERSTERGFQTAKVYKSGQVIDGLGGGICQTSSTLYNAILLADLEITERKNHSLPVGYVDLGRDATVSYGTIDFKFKNDRKTPIKIETSISGGSLTIKILGIKDTIDNRIVSIRTETIQVLPFTEKIIEDTTLPVGTTKITQTGKKGYKVKAYKIVKENGAQVDEKLLSTDTYAPIVQIKRVGIEPTLEGL